MVWIVVLEWNFLEIQSWNLISLLWDNFLFFFSFNQMSGFSRKIFSCPWLLASIAFFPSLEVIVLALSAFPASIRELERFSSHLLFTPLWDLILEFVFLLFFLSNGAFSFWNLLFSLLGSLDYVIGIDVFNFNVLQLLKLLVDLVYIISLLSNVLLLGVINDFDHHHFFFIYLLNLNFVLNLNYRFLEG